MKNMNPKVMAIVALVVTGAAYWMLVLSPKREEATTLATQITAKQGEVTAVQQTLATYTQAKEDYKNNYATVTRLGKAVPEDDDVRSLIVQLDAAAKKTGVDFRSVSIGSSGGGASAGGAAGALKPPPGATVGEAGFVLMPFSFSFDGSFFDLSKFFSKLERFVDVSAQTMDVTGRLLMVDKISLKPEGTGFPNIRAQVGATTYILPPSQGLTAGASPTQPAGASTAQPSGGAAPAAGAASTTATVPGAVR